MGHKESETLNTRKNPRTGAIALKGAREVEGK